MGHFPFTTMMVRFHSAAYEENMFKFIFKSFHMQTKRETTLPV